MADEARACIDEMIRKFRSRRNALSPICRLPSEQLAAIFICCAIDYHHSNPHCPLEDIPSWVNISYVCHHWRNVALKCPRLWSYHFVLSLPWTEELLARSKQALLKIRITFTCSRSSSWWSSLIERLMDHVDRIYELHLHSLHTSGNDRILHNLSSAVPLLKDLQISDNLLRSDSSPALFNGDTQALSTLKLSACSVAWYLLKLSTLTTLQLQSVPNQFRQSSEDFLATLRGMQNLRDLYLDNALASATSFLSSAAFNIFSKSSLPHLSRLSIIAPLSTVTALVSCIGIPAKAELRLECSSEDSSSPDDYTSLSLVLARRFSEPETQALPSSIIRSLIVQSHWISGASITYSMLDHDYDSSVFISDMEWGCNIPLKVTVYWNDERVEEAQVLCDMCRVVPSTGMESLHIVKSPTSLAFWRNTLGHLQSLRYLKLSQGYMPDLASVLSRGVEATSLDRTLVPRLERLVLYQVDFSEEMIRCHLFNALSTRRVMPQGRLILNQCTIDEIGTPDMVRSWDGIISHVDKDDDDYNED